MLCSHRFGSYHVRKQVPENPQFLLRNRFGGFFLWNDSPTSKYQGLWTRMNGGMYKSIAQIRPGVALPVRRATNYFWGFSIDRGNDFHELFYMDPASDSLIYEMKNPTRFSLILDAKEQFDQDEWGRFYDMEEKDGCLLVSYVKKEGEAIRYQFTLAIAGYTEYEIKKEWVRHRYAWDASRQDPPVERPVFHALFLQGRRIVFSVHHERKEALAKARSVLVRARLIKESLERETEMFAKKYGVHAKDHEASVAHLAARFSVQGMLVRDNEGNLEGLYAGIPWFTQFWVRDFVFSANQIPQQDRRDIIMRFFTELEKNGSVHACDLGRCASGADSELLLFSCAADMHKQELFTKGDRERIVGVVQRYIKDVLPGKMRDGLVANGPKETWMDTQFRDDGRGGCCIEIQALALKAYRFAWHLTGNPAYRRSEHELARTVRLRFRDHNAIRDGADDATIRPNIFLAYYFYPDLFLKYEWEKACMVAIDALWLSWGGLATLPKTHPLFCGRDRSGEDPNQSYHHGNAWFFINNIAAVALAQISSKRFKTHIGRLLRASTQDILWHGIAGSHSEVSSANAYEARGCLAQTWSAATYAAALEAIMKQRAQ